MKLTWTGFYDELLLITFMTKFYYHQKFSIRGFKRGYYILTNQAIEEIVQHTPSNPREMLEKCPSVPRTFVDKYAKEFFIVLRKLSKKKKEI